MWRTTSSTPRRRRRRRRAYPGRPSRDAQRARAAVDGERGLERPRLLVEPVREQLGDAVRGERAPEVDGLAARAHQLELRQRSAPALRVPRARRRMPSDARRGRPPHQSLVDDHSRLRHADEGTVWACPIRDQCGAGRPACSSSVSPSPRSSRGSARPATPCARSATSTSALAALEEDPADLVIVDREPGGLDVPGVCRALRDDHRADEAWLLALTIAAPQAHRGRRARRRRRRLPAPPVHAAPSCSRARAPACAPPSSAPTTRSCGR